MRTLQLDNAAQTFRGDFKETKVATAWSSNGPSGFSFTSDPATTSTSLFGVIGVEANGHFYDHPLSVGTDLVLGGFAPGRPAGATGNPKGGRLPASGMPAGLVPAGTGAAALAVAIRRLARRLVTD